MLLINTRWNKWYNARIFKKSSASWDKNEEEVLEVFGVEIEIALTRN
jgi:hypothetical protein|tara:strand:- start:301 stop:441 length:141 start_codon:yes stop_codon:yes gene_type:complete